MPWGGGGESNCWNRLQYYWEILGNGNVYIPPRPFLLGLFAVIFSRFFFPGQRQQRQLHTRPTSIPSYDDTIIPTSNTSFQITTNLHFSPTRSLAAFNQTHYHLPSSSAILSPTAISPSSAILTITTSHIPYKPHQPVCNLPPTPPSKKSHKKTKKLSNTQTPPHRTTTATPLAIVRLQPPSHPPT